MDVEAKCQYQVLLNLPTSPERVLKMKILITRLSVLGLMGVYVMGNCVIDTLPVPAFAGFIYTDL